VVFLYSVNGNIFLVKYYRSFKFECCLFEKYVFSLKRVKIQFFLPLHVVLAQKYSNSNNNNNNISFIPGIYAVRKQLFLNLLKFQVDWYSISVICVTVVSAVLTVMWLCQMRCGNIFASRHLTATNGKMRRSSCCSSRCTWTWTSSLSLVLSCPHYETFFMRSTRITMRCLSITSGTPSV